MNAVITEKVPEYAQKYFSVVSRKPVYSTPCKRVIDYCEFTHLITIPENDLIGYTDKYR
jgi:hypothetical protein